GELTGQVYRIVGNNISLSRLKKIVVAVKNNDSFDNYTGNIWIDELRVSDTQNEKGMAIRGSVNMKFADVATLNVNASKKDAEFHEVNVKDAGKAGGLTDKKSFNLSSNFQVNKLLPKKWGISLPVSGSYSESESSPKYFPGSDIILNDIPDSVKTLSKRKSLSTSFNKKTDTESWLVQNTIEAIKLNLQVSDNESSNFTTKMNKQTNYGGTINYNLKFDKGEGISYLKWIPIFGKKLEGKKFYWKPNNISMKMGMKENKRETTKRINPDSTTITDNFDMNRDANLSYDPFSNISMKYSRGLHSNLKNYIDDKSKLLEKFTPGYVNKRSESFSTTYQLNLVSWFSPKLNYGTSYSYNKPLDRDYASTSVNRSIGTNFTFDFVKVLGSFKRKDNKKEKSASSKKSTNSQKRQRPNVENGKNSEKDDKKENTKKERKGIIDILKVGFGRIDPISVSIRETKNLGNVGVILVKDSLGYGRTTVDPLYRFGFSETPSDSTASEKGDYTLSKRITQQMSLRSGLKITKNMKASLDFKYDISNSFSNGAIQKKIGVSYFPLGEKGSDGFMMPSWNLSWNGLEKVKILDKVFTNLSITHGFKGGKSISFRDTSEQGSQYTQNFSPLAQLNMTFKGNIRSNIGISKNTNISNSSGETRHRISENANMSISYSYSGGLNIPIPFFKDINMTNNITLTINGSYGRSYENKYTEANTEEGFNKNSNWKVKTDLNYQFTKNINGSAFFSYGATENIRSGSRDTKDYGLKVNIRISG
ncbi:MAG: hypothetical protein U9N76_08680, partial [Candidatus Marinimicrobia bacterium]|nr:hypothetical protein [Candidatus Neomarinimicrobiota bacterium]